MWLCQAHRGAGYPGGIAVFVGQVQTAEQTERFVAYQKYEVAGAETASVEMYLWFTRQYTPERYIDQGDFGFCERIAEYSRIWGRPVNREDRIVTPLMRSLRMASAAGILGNGLMTPRPSY